MTLLTTTFAETFAIPRPAEDVWAELTADNALAYARVLGGGRWTSPRPFGVGTTRTMPVAFGALRVDETFFRWEEGRRKSFYVNHANAPLFRAFAEDYLVEPDGPGRCRFTWTIAVEPNAAGRLGAPLNALLVKSLFADTRRHFGAT